MVAFQICWKLWNTRWNRNNDYRKPRILFLADRNILVDDRPKTEYAEILGLKFAYATNGHEILEFDYTTGQEKTLSAYPEPKDLFSRLTHAVGLQDQCIDTLLSPYHNIEGYIPRYYQQIAINRAVQAVLLGNRRVLITMATGTGKTMVAFQICWKLWNTRWNRNNDYRKPRILFLADRNILVDDPKDKTFAPVANGPNICEKTSRISLISTVRAHAKCLTRFWKNIPTSVRNSLKFPTPSRSHPFPNTATSSRSRTFLAARCQ